MVFHKTNTKANVYDQPKHHEKLPNMSKQPTPNYDEVDYTKFVYTEPKRNASGGFNCFINVNESSKASPTFQLPQCTAKFGVNQPIGESTRRNLEVSVADKGVQNRFAEIDQQNISIAAQKSKTFFKKDLSEEILAMTLHRKTLKEDEKNRFDPLLRLKCTPSGKNKTKVYIVSTDANGEESFDDGNLDMITPWSKVIPIVSLSGLWFTSTQFGMSVIAKALMVWPEENKDEVQFNGLNIKKRKLNPVSSSEDVTPSEVVQPSSSGAFDDDDEIM